MPTTIQNLRAIIPNDTFVFLIDEFNSIITHLQNFSVNASDVSYNGNTNVESALNAITSGNGTRDGVISAHGNRLNTIENTSIPSLQSTKITSSQATTIATNVTYDVLDAATTGNTEAGIAVTWDNTTHKLNFDVANFTITFAGDLSGSVAVNDLANATATVNLVNVIAGGTYGSSTSYPVITVDAKGRVTSVSTQTVSGAGGGTSAQTIRDVVGAMVGAGNTESGLSVTYDNTYLNFDLSDYVITYTGDVTGTVNVINNASVSSALVLSSTGATAGTYGNSTTIPVITVDSKGRVTSIGSQAVSTGNQLNSQNVKDIVGGMVSNNTESGINVTYTNSVLNFDVADFTITFSGDITGTVGITNLGNATMTATLPASGVTAGTYGSASSIPIVTVDSKGRVTNAVTTPLTLHYPYPISNRFELSSGGSSKGNVDLSRGAASGTPNINSFIVTAQNNGEIASFSQNAWKQSFANMGWTSSSNINDFQIILHCSTILQSTGGSVTSVTVSDSSVGCQKLVAIAGNGTDANCHDFDVLAICQPGPAYPSSTFDPSLYIQFAYTKAGSSAQFVLRLTGWTITRTTI